MQYAVAGILSLATDMGRPLILNVRQGFLRQPDREPLPWGWSVPLGIVGGIVSGLFGVGGALIVPPALTAFFGVRQVEGRSRRDTKI
jgi:uncharacterized membrane protein YfcA